MNQRWMLGFVAVPLATLAACAFVDDEGGVAAASVVSADAAPDVAPPPRRVCPSAQYPDGGWIAVDGMDVSDWQFTDWDQVVANQPSIKFAFARISSGLVRIDTRFPHDWKGIKRVGLVRGAYQYFKPSQSAIAQADLVVRRYQEAGGLEATDFPPVLDIETTNDMPTETVVCRMKLWLAKVERETKRVPIIYSSIVHNALLGSELGRYPLWVANYVKTPSKTCPMMPDAWNKWAFWQYTESARVTGVYANGARDDLDGGTIALNDEDGGDGGPELPGSDLNFFDGTLADLDTLIARSVSTGDVADPAPLVNPPHVPGASDVVGGPVDCADGCCVGDL